MDERRFDELTKALVAAKPSRREALRRLAGGALATVFAGLALEEASAQIGTEAFDATCEQPGTNFFCFSDAPGSPCKGGECVCARRKEGGRVCVVEPATNTCPTRRTDCNDRRDCDAGHACILVPKCCEDSRRGRCVKRCPRN
jgi:hypothetical protein